MKKPAMKYSAPPIRTCRPADLSCVRGGVTDPPQACGNDVNCDAVVTNPIPER